MKIPCNKCENDIEFDPEKVPTKENNIASLRCPNCGENNEWDKMPWDNEQRQSSE